MSDKPLYPEIRIDLYGSKGKKFYLLGKCLKAASEAGMPKEEIRRFLNEADAGDYDHLVDVCLKWFSCE